MVGDAGRVGHLLFGYTVFLIFERIVKSLPESYHPIVHNNYSLYVIYNQEISFQNVVINILVSCSFTRIRLFYGFVSEPFLSGSPIVGLKL